MALKLPSFHGDEMTRRNLFMGLLGFLGAICFPFNKPAAPTLESVLSDHGWKIADGQLVVKNNMTMAQAVEKVNSYFPAKTYSTICVVGTKMHSDSVVS